jgi:Bacterial archaeo-eukaryotic release factor family 2
MDTSELVDLYADPGPFATAYAELSRDSEDGNQIVALKVREIGDELTRQGASAAVVEALIDRLGTSTHEPAPVSRCVVATENGVLLDRLTRRHHAQHVATWGSLPDLGGWLEDADQAVPFVLALVDHEGGDVSTYSSDSIGVESEASVGKASAFEHKTPGGGWSPLRRQRSAEGVWGRNAEAVAAEIERRVRSGGPELVIIAGDVHSRQLVVDELPDGISADVEVLDHGGRATDGGDDALAEQVESVLRGRVVSRNLATVHELKQRMGQGRSMAIGVADVADAFVLGQVDEMLIDPPRAAGFTLRLADHPGLAIGTIRPEEELRADQALIAAAALTGADVTVTRAGTMGDAPVAALLRWNQETEGVRP